MIGIVLVGLIVVSSIACFAGYRKGHQVGQEEAFEMAEATAVAVSDNMQASMEELEASVTHLTEVNTELVKENSGLQVAVEANQTKFNELSTKVQTLLDKYPNMLSATAQSFNCTAYTLREEECGRTVGEDGYGITASGARVQEWYTIAASKNLPFGTIVYIPYFKDKPNHGIFVVQDRGGAITSGHIDVYMQDYDEAVAFGRQNLEAYVLN